MLDKIRLRRSVSASSVVVVAQSKYEEGPEAPSIEAMVNEGMRYRKCLMTACRGGVVGDVAPAGSR